MSVPSNLVPTRITQLPEYMGTSDLGYLPYVLSGVTYKVALNNILVAGYVPSTRTVTAGAGLTGGGALSSNITLSASFSATNPAAGNTTASPGSASTLARSDHVHPAVNLASATQTQGVLPLSSGGTNGSLTAVAGAIVYSSGSAMAFSAVGTIGEVLTSNGAGTPTWTTLSAGGTVTSVAASGGTTGLTFSGSPITTSGTLTLAGTLVVANGGTGATTLTVNNVLLGNGTSALQVVAPGTSGNVLTSDGTTWASTTPTAGGVTSVAASGGTTGMTFSGSPITTSGTLTLAGTLIVANGGTGATTLTANNVLLGNGTSALQVVAPGTSGNVLTSDGTTWASSAPGGNAYTRTSFTATGGQTTFSVVYTVGYVEVYLNGVLLNGTDYVATNGTTVVLAVAAVLSDIVETFAFNTIPVVITTATNIAGGAAGNIVYQTGAGATGFSAAGTSGQVLLSGGAGSPTWSTLGTGVATFLATPSSANLAAAVTDETGSGALVFATSPSLTTPVLGTPTSGNLANCTADGTNTVGFLTIPQNAQTGSYTLVLADSGKSIFHAAAAAVATYTIPANGSVAYPLGTTVTFINMSTNAVTISITTDTLYLAGTGATGSRTLAQYGVATTTKMTSTTWIISGSGLT